MFPVTAQTRTHSGTVSLSYASSCIKVSYNSNSEHLNKLHLYLRLRKLFIMCKYVQNKLNSPLFSQILDRDCSPIFYPWFKLSIH